MAQIVYVNPRANNRNDFHPIGMKRKLADEIEKLDFWLFGFIGGGMATYDVVDLVRLSSVTLVPVTVAGRSGVNS